MGNEALGRKQRISNDAWIEAMTNIEKSVPKKDLDSKVRQTVKNIKEKTDGKNVAYGWSAGKDSIVLGKICEKAGIKKCVLAVCNLEYPAFEAWAKENAPEGLTIVNTGQDIEWLKSHPEMLFPKDAKTAATWFKIVQHRAQEKYFREKQPGYDSAWKEKGRRELCWKRIQYIYKRQRNYKIQPTGRLDPRRDTCLYPLLQTSCSSYLRMGERISVWYTSLAGSTVYENRGTRMERSV